LLAELLADLTAHLHDACSDFVPSPSAACFPGHQHIVAIDGLRVDYADGFGLIRASNTTPTVTLRFEADTEAALARIAQQFKSAILARRPAALLPTLPTLPTLPVLPC
jgi:phosphomannomutase